MPHHTLFSPEDDIINILWDSVFKATFTQDTPQSQGALRGLLSALTGRPVRVLAVTANEPPVASLTDRQIRYDIRVRFDQGRLADIEMTLNPQGAEPLRLEYYAARLYSSQNIQGRHRGFQDLTPTYQIALIGRRKLFRDEALVHRFEYYDPEQKVSLAGKTRIIVVELEKAGVLLEKPLDNMAPPEWWALFFRYISDPERRDLMNELLGCERSIGMAGEVLLKLSRDEAERARLESEFKYKLDRQNELVEAQRKGLAKGIARERREIAAKLSALGMSPEQIAKVTGISPKRPAD
jgi:predicted transposase/invertase (TIGR01784 family)